jgi:hypothetical protein
MGYTSFYAALPLAVLMLTACDSPTAQNGCNLPTQTASATTTEPPVNGVVRQIKVGAPGQTPNGYNPFTQVDVFVAIPVSDGTATVDIALGAGSPVLVQRGTGSPEATSACDIRVGDRVTVWAPLETVNDTIPLGDDSFEAEKIVIDRGL